MEGEVTNTKQSIGDLFTKEQVEYLHQILGSAPKSATTTQVTAAGIHSMALYSLNQTTG